MNHLQKSKQNPCKNGLKFLRFKMSLGGSYHLPPSIETVKIHCSRLHILGVAAQLQMTEND